MGMYSESSEVEMPHPRLSLAIILIIEDAIRAAWLMLLNDNPARFNRLTALEETINHHLRETLQDRIWNRNKVDGFNGELVACITSAEEIRNFDGKEFKKRPDMIVKLVGLPNNILPSQYGIFIECKPVDANHSLTGDYCKRGIVRFIVGRYAWAMQEALMIGYTQSNPNSLTSLQLALESTANTTQSLGQPSLCPLSNPTSVDRTVVTKHRRRFEYLENSQPAVDITLRHVWLRRD